MDEFMKNHEFLSSNPAMAKDHEYFQKNYYEATEQVYREFTMQLSKLIRNLEAENPELGNPKKADKTGQTRNRGDPLNLDELFKSASEKNPQKGNTSGISESSSGRTGALMQRINDLIDELRTAEDNEDDNAAKKIASVIKKYARIMENQCDIISSPSCNIQQYFELTEEVDTILIKYTFEASNSDNKAMSAKLPKLNVPKFSGDYISYKSFKELFERMVGTKETLDECEKLAYLKGQLRGEPYNLLTALPIENSSYKLAWKKLNDRYENRHIIMTTLFKKLTSGTKMEKFNVASMRNITDEISESVGMISAMGFPENDPTMDMVLYYIVANRIDNVTMAQFQIKIDTAGELRGYGELMEYLQKRIRMLSLEETSKNGKAEKPKKQVRFNEFKKQHDTSRAALVAGVDVAKDKQCDCKEPHFIPKCPVFTALDFNKKSEKSKQWNMCINCLKRGHGWKQCNIPNNCRKCNKKHHTLMHKGNAVTTLLGAAIKNLNFDHVFLATAVIDVIGSNGKPYRARALLDSGSQINIMTQKLFNKIKVKFSKSNMRITGVGASEIESTRRANFIIKSKASGFQANLEAFILKEASTCQPLHKVDISTWNIPKNIHLADPLFNEPASIDLIIGGELFFKLISIGLISIGTSLPDLQNTVFGWVVTGKMLGLHQQEAFVGIVSETTLENQIAKFWQLEERYPERQQMTKKEMDCEEYFHRTTMRDIATGKFVVNLQFLQEPSVLGSSKHMAIRRFLYLEKRFQRDSELKQEYVTFIREYEALHHMEQVNENSIDDGNYFIPHHGVRNPSSSTTKFRVVFDGSAKTTTGISLNEILANGPKLQDDLFPILVRFRTHAVVFSADITKMYRQVEVTESHQKWQMIVWREDPHQQLKFYKLKTLTYGLTCSSYLAIKALHTLAEEHKDIFPEASLVAKRDFNVDDVMTGAENIEKALLLQQQLIDMCKNGHFELHKWCSNQSMILETIPRKKQEVSLDINAEKTETKALGIKWIPKEDIFMLSYVPTEHEKITKRTVLSELAQLFDPLGFVNPVVVLAKVFLQELCKLKLHWDAAIPIHLYSKWLEYRTQLKMLNQVKLQRRILRDDPTDIQLHVFSDASEKAYGSVVYIRSTIENGDVMVALVCSKSRVAPIQPTTLPRLELCGALLAVELAEKMQKTLGIDISSTTYWTDSEVVLSWILSDGIYKTFVANRVAAIKRKSKPESWRYINTKNNPADLVSRGTTPEKLLNSLLWWEGPDFLKQEELYWPQPKAAFVRNFSEEKTIKTVLSASVTDPHFIDQINHRNSINTLQRVVAYALRIIPKNRKNATLTNTLSIEELQAAMTIILKHVQRTAFAEEIKQLEKGTGLKSRFANFSPILDADGVLRVGGRIKAAHMSFTQKHPILLPKTHIVTKLLLEKIHRDNLHAGPQALLAIARQKYWPENGKQLTQSIVRNCVLCVKSKPKLMDQIMGDLPADRVNIARAFLNVSIDFAGPVEIHYTIRGKRSTEGYICIFVCCSTKAIHMEAAIDLSINGFICCLKRFIARRGLPRQIRSDNATNFKGVHNQLEALFDMITDDQNQDRIVKYCQDHEIQWKFSPARSPHFNGLAEAAVKSAKWHLRKILHSYRITYDELVTITAEVEAILNSRPLTPMSHDPNDLQPLTAGHFLIGGPMTALEDRRIIDSPKTKIWYKLVEMRNHFWERWSTEYLAELQSKAKWHHQRNNIKIGTMVMLKEDNTAPLQWRLGRVTQTFSDENGTIRVVELKTAVVKIPDIADGKKRIKHMVVSTKLTRRAIHRICPLPVECNDAAEQLTIAPNVPQKATKIPSASTTVDQVIRSNSIEAPTIAQQIATEKANANTTIEEVAAIRKPAGNLVELYTAQKNDKINAIPDEPVAKRTRSKIRTTLCSMTAVALVFLAFLGKGKADQCTYQTVNNNPGLYFEKMGQMALTHDNWNLICVLRIDQLWSQTTDLETLLKRLDIICGNIKPPKLCHVTTRQLRQQMKLLNEQSDLLKDFSQRSVLRKRRGGLDNDLTSSGQILHRTRRGWANIIGSGLKVVTGVMDNNDSEKIQQQVRYLNDTYHHTMKLIDDQTTIQDITQNIIKRDELNVAKQFTIVDNEILELRNITIENSHFDALSVQTLAMMESYRERINTIIDLITQVRHGHVSTLLITPQQLQQNLEKLSTEIKKNLMIPGDGIQQNLLQLYRVINAEVSVGKQNLIIKLTIPLIEREFYEVYHIIPVPFQNNNNAIQMIHTTTQYMCVNNRQDKYYMISHHEKVACKAFSANIIICEQKHMLYNIYNGSAECEMAVFTHPAKSIYPKCALTTVTGEQIWSKLQAANTFLFSTKTKAIFNIICENESTSCYAEGTGIIQIKPQCVLQTANYEIVASNDEQIGEMEIMIPTLNISDVVIEIPYQSNTVFRNMTDEMDDQMVILKNAIDNQKKQLKNVPNINMHDIHHYTMVYFILVTTIICIGLLSCWIIKTKQQQSLVHNTTPQNRDKQTVLQAQRNVSFSV